MTGQTTSAKSSEQAQDDGNSSDTLPVTHSLKIAFLFSFLIALLTAAASIAGILFPDEIYPTDEQQQSFLANDVVNLFIGLPILLGSMWLAKRGQLIGLLFWPGALLYALYNYLTYLFGMPFDILFPLYLVIVTMSIYTLIDLVASIDGGVVKQRLGGQVPERLAGGVLFILGVVFGLFAMSVILSALLNETSIAQTELGLSVSDFIVSWAWVIGGVLLWRRRPLGYVGGTGLLFNISMLFIGLIAVLILNPLLTGEPFALTDVIVVFVMSLIAIVPLILFIRGVRKS
jgi:hypothetical protein